MHSICVWNMIKQSKFLQTRYDTTYIYDRYYIFLVWKNAGLNYREIDLEGYLVGVYMVFIDPVFHNTSKTCLKRIAQSGNEWVEKEMCRFAEDMS